MKRVLTVLAVLALATPVFASKPRTIPPHVTDAAPATVTITGTPLTIVIGDETSMEVYNSTRAGRRPVLPDGLRPRARPRTRESSRASPA